MIASRLAWEPSRLEHAHFATIADLVARIAQEPDWPSIATLNQQFGAELARVGVRFVEAAKLKTTLGPDGTIEARSLYEVRVVECGEIATRPRNAHDLLNALVWAAFPQTKLALTHRLAELQRERAAGRSMLPSMRTSTHDRLAMFDEGAVLCVRGQHAVSRWIFGHAIYEHAYAGVFDVRGAAIDLAIPAADEIAAPEARAAIDHVLATADLMAIMRRGAGIPV